MLNILQGFIGRLWVISNDLIIQWGKYISGQSAKDHISVHINFSISFPYYPIAFSAVASDYSDICSIRNDTTTGFDVYIYERFVEYLAFANFWWTCIGY